MTGKAEIRRYLWDSLEMGCIRRDAILSTVLVFLLVGLRSCTVTIAYNRETETVVVIG